MHTKIQLDAGNLHKHDSNVLSYPLWHSGVRMEPWNYQRYHFCGTWAWRNKHCAHFCASDSFWTKIKPHIFMFVWSGRKPVISKEDNMSDWQLLCNYKGNINLILHTRLKVDRTVQPLSLGQLWHNWCLPLSTAWLFVWWHWHCSHSSAQLTGCLEKPSCPYKDRPSRLKRSCPFFPMEVAQLRWHLLRGTGTNPLSPSLL